MSTQPEETNCVLPLHVEEVAVSKRRVDGETLTVNVVTREHRREIDELLTHERVEIDRVPIGQRIDTVPPIREEGDTTIVPVVEEVIVVERHLILKEEVHIKRLKTNAHHKETVVTRDQEAIITRIDHETNMRVPE